MPRRKARLRRCAFGTETYQCGEPGIGNPPLCREHFALVQNAADEGQEVSLLQEAVNLFLAHPSVKDVIGRIEETFVRACEIPGLGAARPHAQPQYGHTAAPPPPSPPPESSPDPRAILHFGPTEPLTRTKIKQRQRKLAELAHPDRGGSKEAMQRINAAASMLLSQLP